MYHLIIGTAQRVANQRAKRAEQTERIPTPPLVCSDRPDAWGRTACLSIRTTLLKIFWSMRTVSLVRRACYCNALIRLSVFPSIIHFFGSRGGIRHPLFEHGQDYDTDFSKRTKKPTLRTSGGRQNKARTVAGPTDARPRKVGVLFLVSMPKKALEETTCADAHNPGVRTSAQCLIEAMIIHAVRGNAASMREICDRVDGKIPDPEPPETEINMEMIARRMREMRSNRQKANGTP
jgi:hypothetical protein